MTPPRRTSRAHRARPAIREEPESETCRHGGTPDNPCYYSLCEPCGVVRDARFREDVRKARAKIIAQAGPVEGEGWLTLQVPAGKVRRTDIQTFETKETDLPAREVRVPKAPFYHWALEHTSGRHLAPAWEFASRGGWKQGGDSEAHTDWVIGAGIGPDDPEWADGLGGSTPLMKAAWDARWKIQESLLEFKVHVLNDAGHVSGIVVHSKPGESVEHARDAMTRNRDRRNKLMNRSKAKGKVCIVAVLPNGSPDYTAAALSADALIIEQGGTTCHLAIVARERKLGKKRAPITIVQEPSALTKYPRGTSLSIYPERGEVHVSSVVPSEASHLYYFGRLPKEDE